ncbi:MAG: hypothetical protein H6Q66_669 [Firmicutes bacterium]|nr:hypothetical protein [Bacillota bacterium]
MSKLRLKITKGEELRFISHLDYVRAITRAVRRAKLPAAYSEGFNPHMKVAFASALAVGVTSDAEYMDLDMEEQIEPSEVIARLNAVLPPGIQVREAGYVDERAAALMAVVDQTDYQIMIPVTGAFSVADAQMSLTRFAEMEKVVYVRHSPKGKRFIDLKQYIAHPLEMENTPQTVQLSLSIKMTSGGSVKPSEILDVLVSDFGFPVQSQTALIHRTALWAAADGKQVSPLALEQP